MKIETIMVIGSGFMGSGIAQIAAQGGYKVILYDIASEAVAQGIEIAKKNLTRYVEKGRLTHEEMKAALGLISGSTSLEDGRAAELIIEAVYEDAEVKKEVFRKLDRICQEDCIFASNTSSIPITQLAAAVRRPDQFAGMHFFSPVPVMKLCEIIRGLKTSEATIQSVKEVAEKMKKETVIAKDVPGFIVNRINTALKNEAYKCLQEGVASLEDIDKALRLGLNHPMGPFELADFAGLDIGFNVAKTLYEGYKDPKWAPNAMLEKLIVSGDLGRKTGKGWYDYTSGEKKRRTDISF